MERQEPKGAPLEPNGMPAEPIGAQGVQLERQRMERWRSAGGAKWSRRWSQMQRWRSQMERRRSQIKRQRNQMERWQNQIERQTFKSNARENLPKTRIIDGLLFENKFTGAAGQVELSSMSVAGVLQERRRSVAEARKQQLERLEALQER